MRGRIYIFLFLLISISYFHCAPDSINETITAVDLHKLDLLLDADQGFKAFSLADSLLKINSNDRTSENYLKVLHAKGRALEYIVRLEESLKVYSQLLKAANQASNLPMQAQAYLSIVRIDENLGRKADWKRNLQHARTLIQKNELWSVYSEYAVRMASYQRYHGNKDSVFYYGQKAVEFGNRFNDFRNVGDGYFLCGVAEKTDTGKITYFNQSITALKKVDNWYGVAYRYLAIAGINLENKNYTNFKSNADSLSVYIDKLAGSSFRKERLYELKENYYQLYSDYYLSISRQDSAYIYLLKSKEFLQLSITEKANGAINDEAIDIAIVASEQKNEDLKYLNKVLGIILGTMIIIGLILFFTLRKINKQKRELLTKSDKILQQTGELEVKNHEQKILLSEIHHRVKNNLQLVISILMLKIDEIEDENFRNKLEEITGKIQSMALIHEQLYRVGNFTDIEMASYLTDLVSYMQDIGNQKRKVNMKSFVPDDISLNIDTAIPLGILLIELMNNSFKHADPVEEDLSIYIALNKKTSEYELIYTDNGRSFDGEKAGMGSVLVQSMARQLKGDLVIDTRCGYSVNLTFAQKMVSPLSKIMD